jgi:hypothetical protein
MNIFAFFIALVAIALFVVDAWNVRGPGLGTLGKLGLATATVAAIAQLTIVSSHVIKIH